MFDVSSASAGEIQMLLSDKFVPSSNCQSSPIIRDSPIAEIEMAPAALARNVAPLAAAAVTAALDVAALLNIARGEATAVKANCGGIMLPSALAG